jgi:L-fuculose-phosphate aldolase
MGLFDKEPLSDAETREQLLWVAQEMLRTNLVEGTAGHCAARLPDGNAVLTPSSLDYLEMSLDDLVVCDMDGNVLEGHRSPTSEKALHLTALRDHPEIGATMHCHAKFSTMFALTRTPIPAVIEEFDVFVGGDVDVAEYKTTGTEDLAFEVASHVGKKAAVLMANHGLFAVGKNPKDVLHIAALIERTAEIIWGARALGTVVPLPEAVNQQFSGYYRYGRTGSFD